ncbi:MAG: hypothetical protein WBB43_06765 [Limnoraphis sp.]
MSIRIPYKFGCKAKPKLPKSNVSTIKAFSEKLEFNREHIQPHLGDLFFLYRNYCFIFMPAQFGVLYYCGSGYGVYDDQRDEDYDKIGQILARI